MGRLALCDVVGPLNDLNQKLAGENGEEWLRHLKKMLRGEGVAQVKMTWLQAEEKAYDLMDLASEYVEFRQKASAKEISGRWTVCMVKGISCAKIVSALQKSGSGFWSYYDDLDKETADDPVKKIRRNDRDPNRDGSYIRSFLAVIEADEENANKSANQLKEEGHEDITLMERLFLELVYFLMTGEHLDVINVTLCSGS